MEFEINKYLILKEVSNTNNDFINLVNELNKDLAIRNGAKNDFFVSYNGLDNLTYILVAYWNNKPVGCGAFKVYDAQCVEIKRMYLLPEYRGMGIASVILNQLEQHAKKLDFVYCILETGKQMPEAIGLYKKSNYSLIPNYEPYVNVEESVCFKKKIY
jgi:putative acetyltransferase